MKTRIYKVTIPEEPDDYPHLTDDESHRVVLKVILQADGYKEVDVELMEVKEKLDDLSH